jgi:hypothetical protein
MTHLFETFLTFPGTFQSSLEPSGP